MIRNKVAHRIISIVCDQWNRRPTPNNNLTSHVFIAYEFITHVNSHRLVLLVWWWAMPGGSQMPKTLTIWVCIVNIEISAEELECAGV